MSVNGLKLNEAAKLEVQFEQVVLADAEWDDLDPTAIELYRNLRAGVRPNAEERFATTNPKVRKCYC